MKKKSQYTTLSKIMTVFFAVLCLFWIMPVVEVLINSLYEYKNEKRTDTGASTMPDTFVRTFMFLIY